MRRPRVPCTGAGTWPVGAVPSALRPPRRRRAITGARSIPQMKKAGRAVRPCQVKLEKKNPLGAPCGFSSVFGVRPSQRLTNITEDRPRVHCMNHRSSSLTKTAALLTTPRVTNACRRSVAVVGQTSASAARVTHCVRNPLSPTTNRPDSRMVLRGSEGNSLPHIETLLTTQLAHQRTCAVRAKRTEKNREANARQEFKRGSS